MESHQISDGGDCVWGPSHRQLGPAMLAEYPGKVLHSFGLTRELWLHCRLCKRGLLDNLSLLDNGLDSVGLEMMNILFEKEYLKFFSVFIIFMT